jgi:prepilin-type N-terminal cleavage/methylation domain-containing protein
MKPEMRRSGFTLLEMAISLAILSLLLGSVFSITFETCSFLGDNEVDSGAQAEATQAFDRMTEILRKCGWNTAAGTTYPRAIGGGSGLEFRVLRDLDGNGYSFSAATGEPEYGAKVYSIHLDGAGNLGVYDGATPVWHLARRVQTVSFATYLEDPSLQMKEIRVSVLARKMTKRGEPIDFQLVGSIGMRN